jgi:hypothetical protein
MCLRLPELQDARQDLDRGPARGRPAGHLHPFRHRQLPPDHRAHLHRPQPLHLRRRAGAGRDQGLQLCRRLCRARGAGKPRHLAAQPEIADHRRARGRGRACARGQARHGLGQDEQPDRARRDRRALRGEPGGREDRPRDPGHLRVAPRDRGAEREHPGEIHRRPVPRAFAHRLFRQRPRAAAQEGEGLYQLRRLDGAQPQPPGGDAGGMHQRHGEGADRGPDHGREPRRRGAKLGVAARRVVPARGSGDVENPFSCHRFFMENPSLSGAGRPGRRTCRT